MGGGEGGGDRKRRYKCFNKLFHPREKAEAKIVFETFDGEPINSKLLRIPLHETLFLII